MVGQSCRPSCRLLLTTALLRSVLSIYGFGKNFPQLRGISHHFIRHENSEPGIPAGRAGWLFSTVPGAPGQRRLRQLAFHISWRLLHPHLAPRLAGLQSWLSWDCYWGHLYTAFTWGLFLRPGQLGARGRCPAERRLESRSSGTGTVAAGPG